MCVLLCFQNIQFDVCLSKSHNFFSLINLWGDSSTIQWNVIAEFDSTIALHQNMQVHFCHYNQQQSLGILVNEYNKEYEDITEGLFYYYMTFYKTINLY